MLWCVDLILPFDTRSEHVVSSPILDSSGEKKYSTARNNSDIGDTGRAFDIIAGERLISKLDEVEFQQRRP